MESLEFIDTPHTFADAATMLLRLMAQHDPVPYGADGSLQRAVIDDVYLTPELLELGGFSNPRQRGRELQCEVIAGPDGFAACFRSRTQNHTKTVQLEEGYAFFLRPQDGAQGAYEVLHATIATHGPVPVSGMESLDRHTIRRASDDQAKQLALSMQQRIRAAEYTLAA